MESFQGRLGIRLAAPDGWDFLKFFLSKVSPMLLFMLPIVALCLKLLYISTSKRYYMQPFIFILLILATALLCNYYQRTTKAVIWAKLLIIIYIAEAFRQVYSQRWFKMVAKMFVLFINYVLSLFLLLTLVVSALLV